MSSLAFAVARALAQSRRKRTHVAIEVRPAAGASHRGRLRLVGSSVSADGPWTACTLGRNGIGVRKREGDGATPVGTFSVVCVLYRPDRIARPRCPVVPVRALDPNDGWCDDPERPFYNRPVRLPCAGSRERLWREDGLYDIVVVLDVNLAPAQRWAGSAIFWHVAAADISASTGATAGCVAMPRDALRHMLRRLPCGAALRVRG